MPSRQTDSIVYRKHSLTTRTNHSRHFARSAGFAGVKGMLYESPEGEGADPHAIRPHRTFNSDNFVYPAPRSRAYMSIRHLQGAASDRPQQRRRRTSAEAGHITRQQAHTARAHPSHHLLTDIHLCPVPHRRTTAEPPVTTSRREHGRRSQQEHRQKNVSDAVGRPLNTTRRQAPP